MPNEFGKSTALLDRPEAQRQNELSPPKVHQPASAIWGVTQKQEYLSKFLMGWKEIGNYLGRGVRTVQRYERRFGLPVRRTSGKSWGPVLAIRDEIDAWVGACQMREGLRHSWIASESLCVELAALERGITHMKKRHQTNELTAELREIVRLLRARLPAHDTSQPSEAKQGHVPVLPQLGHSYFCWICGNGVDLKICVTDENGMAVHEDCYVVRMMLASESIKLARESQSSTEPVWLERQNGSTIHREDIGSKRNERSRETCQKRQNKPR
jgi:hypothetical protein